MKALFVTLALLGGALAFAEEPGTRSLPPAQEARAERIGKQLRCAVCQGMSVTDSPSMMARAQLDKVREMVEQGKTDDEIRDYFVARYGTWILLNPPAEGFGWLVWLLPGVMVLGGAVVVMRTVKRSASAAPPTPPAEPGATPTTDSSTDPYLAKVRAELER